VENVHMMHAIVLSGATWNIAATIAATPPIRTSPRLPVIAAMQTADKQLPAKLPKNSVSKTLTDA
jgi:hypothetical protein